jgi:D-glycero-D-manno-heptose 1,7-bisphosphate phosphatase
VRIVFSERASSVPIPAVFLDRDGVLNERIAGGYVLDWSQFRFVSGIRPMLEKMAGLGLPIVVISNQAGIGRGLMTRRALEDITARLHSALLQRGIFITAFYYCPHEPSKNCKCRKPKPDLIFQAASDLGIDLAGSVFVGDSDSDVGAALSAGCAPILFGRKGPMISKSLPGRVDVPVAKNASELFKIVRGVLSQKNPEWRFSTST